MGKKLKILFLLHLPPPVHGSAVVGLSIKESPIINKEFNCQYINLLASNRVAESGTVNFKKVVGFIKTWIRLLIIIIRNRPDMCYFALTSKGAAFYRDLLLIVLLKAFRIKLVYHLHNKGISLYQNRRVYRISYRIVFHHTEVILISKYLYQDIKTFVPEFRVHYCSNGIKDIQDVSFNHLNGRKPQELLSKKPVQLLFLSNLMETKGVFILLAACSILKGKNLFFECVFIGGEGDITVSMFNNKVSQLFLSDIVSYQGVKFGEEKLKAFAETDIFVFPTYFETFGLVNLEAMQYSKPVVSTNEGGIPDIIEDGITGFLVPPKDAQKLASKLELLINNQDLRHQMGIAGRKKYEQQFTQEIFENRLQEILQHTGFN